MHEEVLCGECGSSCGLVDGEDLFPKSKHLFGKKYWVCYGCRAHCGCLGHSVKTDSIPAGPRTRNARQRAWRSFRQLWEGSQKFMTQKEATRWLAGEMKIPLAECRFGRMMFDDALNAAQLCEEKRDSHIREKREALIYSEKPSEEQAPSTNMEGSEMDDPEVYGIGEGALLEPVSRAQVPETPKASPLPVEEPEILEVPEGLLPLKEVAQLLEVPFNTVRRLHPCSPLQFKLVTLVKGMKPVLCMPQEEYNRLSVITDKKNRKRICADGEPLKYDRVWCLTKETTSPSRAKAVIRKLKQEGQWPPKGIPVLPKYLSKSDKRAMQKEESPELLEDYTIPELAEGLEVDPSSIGKACVDGRIASAYKDSKGRWRIPREDRKYIQRPGGPGTRIKYLFPKSREDYQREREGNPAPVEGLKAEIIQQAKRKANREAKTARQMVQLPLQEEMVQLPLQEEMVPLYIPLSMLQGVVGDEADQLSLEKFALFLDREDVREVLARKLFPKLWDKVSAELSKYGLALVPRG